MQAQPFLVLVKKNDVNHYVGHIVPKFGNEVPKSMMTQDLFSIKQWVIQNEAHHRNQGDDPILKHMMDKTRSPAMTGLMMFAGINISIADFNSSLAVIDSMTEHDNVITLKYRGGSLANVQSVKGESRIRKYGKFLFLEESDASMDMKVRDGTLNRTHIRIEYTLCGQVTVPFKKTVTWFYSDRDGHPYTLRETNDFSFTPLISNMPFEMATFGLPERQPKLIIANAPVVAETGSIDSSIIENIPIWGWLAGGGMTFILLGMLLIMTRPRNKATS